MKGLHGGIPLAVLAAVARAQVDGIGGAHGLDSGNAGGVSTDNEFGRANAEVNKDDHHVDIDTKTKVDVDVGPYPEPYWHHWRPAYPPHWRKARGDGGNTLIDGPGGVDSGNAASVPTKNEFESNFNEANGDDHSKHAKGKADVEVDDWDRKRGHHFEDRPVTLIDGPGGVDSGNSASLPTTNKFASFYDESNKDDHSVDIDEKYKYDYDVHGHPYPVPVPGPHHWKARGFGDTLIGGSHGVDSGNSASIPTENSFASFYDEKNKDDHSIDIDEKFKYDYDVHGHPYPVPVPGHPWKRSHHGPVTFIDGPGGVDSGNSASLPTDNEFASFYKEQNEDDHSVDVDQKFDYDYDNHAYPVPVPARPHHWKARQLGDTLIDGPGGADSGNSASIPTKNQFGAAYSETNIDDHSVDIDHKTNVDVDKHYGYPVPVPVHPAWPHHWKARGLGDTFIDGPGGADSGNSASIPTKNEFGVAYSETNIDDHSVDIDYKTDVDVDKHYGYPVPVPVHPHWPHHWKARQHGNTVIDGSDGVDRGSDASIPTKNEFGVAYSEYNKDDHSVDIDSKTDVDIDSHAYPVPFPVPVHHHPAPFHLHARGLGDTLIDGPGGFDSGNSFSAPTQNEYTSVYGEVNKDDHSFTGKADTDIDVDHHLPYPVPVPVYHHWKARSHRHDPSWKDVTFIDGPGGIDTGNDADLSRTNTFLSDYDEFNQDDHSFDGKAEADYDIDYRRSLHARFGDDLIDGPGGYDSGNSFSAPTNNNFVTGYSEHNEDDHSVDVDHETDVDVDAHHPVPVPVPAPEHPHPNPHPHPQPPHPVHEPQAEPEPAPVHAPHPPAEGHVPHEAPHADPAPAPVSQPIPQAEESKPAPASGNFHAPEPASQPIPQAEQSHPAPPMGNWHAPQPETQEAPPSGNFQPQPVSQPSPQVQHSQPSPPSGNFQAPEPASQDTPQGQQWQPSPPSGNFQAPEPASQDTPQGQQWQPSFPSAGFQAPQPDYQMPSPQTGNSEPSAPSAPAPAYNPPSNNMHNNFPPFAQSAGAPPAPSADFGDFGYQPAPLGSETQEAPVFHGMATPSSSAVHMVMTSTVQVPQASSFAKIPIYVPKSSPVAAPSAHAPVASTVVVHPTGASASTPTAASTGGPIASRADTLFTGGVARMTPHAGVFSVVAGAVALLAFVL